MQLRVIPFFLALCFALPAQASEAEDIARVENYLSSINSFQADFNQVSADGSTGTGKFYLKRPGKMLWSYNPPVPIQIVSNGTVVTYYDPTVQQVSYVGVGETMAGFLAQKTIALKSDSTELLDFDAEDGAIRATIARKGKKDEGTLTLEFSDKPLQLRQMTVVDATGNSTRIQFQNAKFDMPLADSLFVFKDPRGVITRKKN